MKPMRRWLVDEMRRRCIGARLFARHDAGKSSVFRIAIEQDRRHALQAGRRRNLTREDRRIDDPDDGGVALDRLDRESLQLAIRARHISRHQIARFPARVARAVQIDDGMRTRGNLVDEISDRSPFEPGEQGPPRGRQFIANAAGRLQHPGARRLRKAGAHHLVERERNARLRNAGDFGDIRHRWTTQARCRAVRGEQARAIGQPHAGPGASRALALQSGRQFFQFPRPSLFRLCTAASIVRCNSHILT